MLRITERKNGKKYSKLARPGNQRARVRPRISKRKIWVGLGIAAEIGKNPGPSRRPLSQFEASVKRYLIMTIQATAWLLYRAYHGALMPGPSDLVISHSPALNDCDCIRKPRVRRETNSCAE